MNIRIQLAAVALLFSLLVVAPCETIGTSSPFPSSSDVASIGNGTDLTSLGIGNVPLGGSVGNINSGVSFDDNSLKELSDMINQLLASLNSTSSTISQNTDSTEQR